MFNNILNEGSIIHELQDADFKFFTNHFKEQIYTRMYIKDVHRGNYIFQYQIVHLTIRKYYQSQIP